MSGRKGRSGGHNRLPIDEHVRRGTFNPTRHGPRPSSLALVPPFRDTPKPIPPDVRQGLGKRGLAFVNDCWKTYSGWTPPTLALLREAGHLADQLETLRGQRGERAAQRLFMQTIAALHLRD